MTTKWLKTDKTLLTYNNINKVSIDRHEKLPCYNVVVNETSLSVEYNRYYSHEHTVLECVDYDIAINAVNDIYKQIKEFEAVKK